MIFPSLLKRKNPNEALWNEIRSNQELLKFCEDADRSVRYTSDAWMLERYTHWNLFVYSNEQRHMKKHSKLGKDAEYANTSFTCPSFASIVYQIGGDSFAVALDEEGKDTPPWAAEGFSNFPQVRRIRGEVYTVPSQQFFELDEHMLNGVMFRRRRTTVKTFYKFHYEKDGQRIVSDRQWGITVCWMYVGVPEFWDQIIDAGYLTKPTKVYRPSDEDIPIHSHFTTMDIDSSDQQDSRKAHTL